MEPHIIEEDTFSYGSLVFMAVESDLWVDGHVSYLILPDSNPPRCRNSLNAEMIRRLRSNLMKSRNDGE